MKKHKYKNVLHIAAFLLTNILASSLSSCGGGGGGGDDENPVDNWTTTPAAIKNAPVAVPTQLSCKNGTALTYENFGESFLLNYCTSCHSSHLTGADRLGAPDGVDFDKGDDVLLWRAAMANDTKSVKDATMPPSRLLPAEDISRFQEWLNCGAPGKMVNFLSR